MEYRHALDHVRLIFARTLATKTKHLASSVLFTIMVWTGILRRGDGGVSEDYTGNNSSTNYGEDICGVTVRHLNILDIAFDATVKYLLRKSHR